MIPPHFQAHVNIIDGIPTYSEVSDVSMVEGVATSECSRSLEPEFYCKNGKSNLICVLHKILVL